MRRLLATSFVLLSCVLALGGDAKSEIAQARKAAATHAAAGDVSNARQVLLDALALDPTSFDLLGDLLALSGDDADETLVRALLLARRTVDARGKVKAPPRASPGAKAALKTATALAKKRANALNALAKLAKPLRDPEHAGVARRLRRIAAELAGTTPANRAAGTEPFQAAIARCAVDRDAVVERLRKAVDGQARPRDLARRALPHRVRVRTALDGNGRRRR